MTEPAPIPLKSFLQLLTSSNVSISRAMGIAGKIYKQVNTPEKLGQLTDSALIGLGVSDQGDRKGVLDAAEKAGYRAQAVASAGKAEGKKRKASRAKQSREGSVKQEGGYEDLRDGGGSGSRGQTKSSASPRKRRKVSQTKNEFLPDKPFDEGELLGSLDFDETLDEEALRGKFAVINRAPIMMAWSYIVAEHMGFQREESFSIASVYTEMNALTKGVSLGIYKKGRDKGLEASPDGTQPYVDLMGRRIPLFQTAAGAWRALDADAQPASSAAAFSYISRSFKQTAPAIIGALRLLAESFPPDELNRLGWSLYADFRPEVDGWGKRGEVRCDKILSLRKAAKHEQTGRRAPADAIKYEVRAEQALSNAGGLLPIVNDTDDAKTGTKEPPDEDEVDEYFNDEFTTEELAGLP